MPGQAWCPFNFTVGSPPVWYTIKAPRVNLGAPIAACPGIPCLHRQPLPPAEASRCRRISARVHNFRICARDVCFRRSLLTPALVAARFREVARANVRLPCQWCSCPTPATLRGPHRTPRPGCPAPVPPARPERGSQSTAREWRPGRESCVSPWVGSSHGCRQAARSCWTWPRPSTFPILQRLLFTT